MVVDMYIIGPKKDQFKLIFFGLFDFSKMKRPRPRLQKTNKQSFLVLVLFGLSLVQLQSFASPRTGLSNTRCNVIMMTWHQFHTWLLQRSFHLLVTVKASWSVWFKPYCDQAISWLAGPMVWLHYVQPSSVYEDLCLCHTFTDLGGFTRHEKSCHQGKKRLASTLTKVKEVLPSCHIPYI